MRSLLATLAAFSLASIAGAQAMTTRSDRPDTTRVVFVCEHGAAKSVVAAALFNRMAAERGLAAQAVARGTEPDTVIPAHVRDGLRADGADIGDARPRRASPRRTDGARGSSSRSTWTCRRPPPVSRRCAAGTARRR